MSVTRSSACRRQVEKGGPGPHQGPGRSRIEMGYSLKLFGCSGSDPSAPSGSHAGTPGAPGRNGSVRIETSRLVLRPFDEMDFPAFLEIMRDPQTFGHANRGPMEEEEAWNRLLRHIGHWTIKGYGLFAVEEKMSGLLVGEAGLNIFRRDFRDDADTAPEALWAIARWAQRRGYATEAGRAALEWAEKALGIDRTVCLISRTNLPSLRVAAKLGYVCFREVAHGGAPCLLMERNDGGSARLISGHGPPR